MNHKRLLNNRSVGDRRGQVAVFIALIFQLLFLFFAMVVNVGLLVHHKINLQNSVDLAAYYGAMKQAELMNAIAHINYQIRQDFKLMTWRYRVLGTAGVHPNTNDAGQSYTNAHPVSKDNEAAVNSGNHGGTIIGGQDAEDINHADNLADFYDRPAFCIAFKPFKEMPDNENTCQTPKGQTIPGLKIPPVIASFVGLAHTAQQVTIFANQAQKLRCEYAGAYNYVALAHFVTSYNIDQGNRKLLIYKLANGMSQSAEDFTDIEGEKASEGIKKTLTNNLTAANNDALEKGVFKIYNSLGHTACSRSPTGSGPPRWLSDVIIYPRSSYKYCEKGGGEAASIFTVVNIDRPPTTNVPPDLQPAVNYLSQMIMAPATGAGSHYRPSLGVEKNPWCMAYVGVRAETEPDIPFAVGKVRLKAVAFAKPFGGRIGPWYGKTWSRSAEESQGNGEDTRSDPRTPIRCPLGNVQSCTVSGQDKATTLNFSRFPGDPWGLSSRRVQGQYGKSIYDMGNPSLAWWHGIEVEASSRGGEWDALAWDGSPENKMRKLEISAVVPDLFDMTYYSIDPDFYNNYYKGRIENYLQKNPINVGSRFVPRLDIGSRSTGSYNGKSLAAFNIKDQMRVSGSLMNTSNNSYGIDPNGKLLYMLAETPGTAANLFGRLLTSWIPPKDIDDYEFKPDERFGRCGTPATDNAPVPGSCEKGGRTGYSVKLVASDYLLDTHQLGGQSGGSDHIKNPPPDEFYK